MTQRRADGKQPAQSTGRRGKSLPAALCGAVGRIILLLVIVVCLPAPLARVCGYEVYNVVSGSMEPAIPVCSAVFVRPAPPAQLCAQDVIAFQSHGTVITHRVVQNNTLESSLVTQGDANLQPDPEAVPYGSVIGRVERHVPGLGWLLGASTGASGRLYLVCLAAAGALLSLVPVLLQKRQGPGTGERRQAEPGPARPSGAPEREKPGMAERVRRVLMLLLAVVLVVSLGGYALTQRRARQQRQAYTDLAQQYTAAPGPAQGAAAQGSASDAPPITVDFQALQAANSDIVGWIYCEGTQISYPVLYGETNDTYLRQDAEKNYNVAGSIFIEAQNSADFSDVNTILYGHHMNDGSMFAALENWQDQAFWDAHPVLWLFTPAQTYRLAPFSAYETSAYSETYTIFSAPCEQLNTYLRAAQERSAVQAGAAPDGTARYVLLSTCASAFDSGEARSVLHCVLEPAA